MSNIVVPKPEELLESALNPIVTEIERATAIAADILGKSGSVSANRVVSAMAAYGVDPAVGRSAILRLVKHGGARVQAGQVIPG